jgi:hypothetical protein
MINAEGFLPSDFSIDDKYEIPIIVSYGGRQYGAISPIIPPKVYGLRLGYRNTQFEFIIEYNKSNYHQFSGYYTSFTPDNRHVKFPSRGSYCDYIQMEEYLLLWFNEIREFQRQMTEPDLWSKAIHNQIFTNDSFEENDDKFTDAEKETLKNAISKLELTIKKSFELNQHQNEYVNKRLKYLTDSVDRQNKFDWKGTLLQTMISIGVNLSFDTHQGNILFGLFQSAFVGLGHMLQLM